MNASSKSAALVRRGQLITILGIIGLAGIFVRALAFTPVERLQGPAQKIFYVHVPAAWAGLSAFVITGLLSVLFLIFRDKRVDRAAAASAEVGVVMCVILLITGPLWGKPVWGTWWSWDARLTSTLFVFLLFVGYLLLRGSVIDVEARGRLSSIIGVLGLILVPFVHVTVYMFRTLHPQPIVLKPSTPSLPGEMLVTLLSSVGVFTILYVGFTIQRFALAEREEQQAEELFRAAR